MALRHLQPLSTGVRIPRGAFRAKRNAQYVGRTVTWFQVDDHLNGSPELLSIPRNHRPQCVGVWTLCGSYVADQLTNGFIPDEVIKAHGAHRNKVREYLVTAGFWVEVPGGVQLQPLYCRWQSREDAANSRYSTARRVANYRARKQEDESGEDTTLQQRCSSSAAALQQRCNNAATTSQGGSASDLGQQDNVTVLRPADAGTGTGTGGVTPNYLPSQAELLRKSGTGHTRARPTMDLSRLCGNDPAPQEPPPPDRHVPPEATELVKAAVPTHIWRNQKTRWGLVTQTATLLNNGSEPDDVRRALDVWVATPDVYPGHLAHILTDVIKQQTTLGNGNGPLRGADKKAADWLALGKEHRDRR